LLKGKKAAVITSTGGAVFVEKIWLGNRSLKVVVKDILGFCGIKAKGYMIGSANRFTEKNKRVIEGKVKRVIGDLS
jgi:FMN-dependent NADH-azoreductase